MTNGAYGYPSGYDGHDVPGAVTRQSSLRSSVSRLSGNADVNAPQSAPIYSRPYAPAPGIATSHRGRGGDTPAGDPAQGAGQGSQRSRRQGLRQRGRPGSGPKPFLAEQGKGNA